MILTDDGFGEALRLRFDQRVSHFSKRVGRGGVGRAVEDGCNGVSLKRSRHSSPHFQPSAGKLGQVYELTRILDEFSYERLPVNVLFSGFSGMAQSLHPIASKCNSANAARYFFTIR